MRPEPSFARSTVAWSNACLRGDVSARDFDAWWPRFQYVRTLAFHDGLNVLAPAAPWIDSLRALGPDVHVRFDALSTAGFERIVVCGAHAFSSWRQQWQRIAGAKQPPWFDATFTREQDAGGVPPRGRSVDAVLRDLTNALEGLVALSQRADLEQWGSYFERVLRVALGEIEDGESPLPPPVSRFAHRLARAANLSDVFGGMGSWNDFGPLAEIAAEDERNRCSSALYDAMREALVATAHAGRE